MSEHPPPQKKPEDEKPSSSAMLGAFARAEKEKREKSAEEAKRREKKNQKNRKGKKPFDPHSVPSALSVQEQKLHATIREEEIANGVELRLDPGITEVDISGIRVDQYNAPAAAREGLEKLNDSSVIEEPPIVPDLEDAPDNVKEPLSSTPDGTRDWRKKWLGRLGALIKNAPERVLGTERYERTKAYLAERSQKIDAEAKQMGRTYECVKSIGEWYNRRHIVTKSAIGLALAGGTIATMGVSASMAPAFMTLIGAQRAIAAMGIFATTENKIKDSKYLSKRDKAAVSMVGSIAYSLLAGYAIKEGVEWASDTRAGEAAQDLVRHYFSGSPVETPARQGEPIRTEATKTVSAPASVPPPDVLAGPAQAPSVETPAPAVKEEGVLGSAIEERIEVQKTESSQIDNTPDTAETPPEPGATIGFQMSAASAEMPTVTAQPEVAAPSAPDVGVIPPPEKVISGPTSESPPPRGPVTAAPSGEGSVLPEAGGAPSEPLIEVKNEPEPKFAQVSVDSLGNVFINGVPEESGAPTEPSPAKTPLSAPPESSPAEPVESTHVAEREVAPPAPLVVGPLAEPPPVRIDVLDYPARSGEPLIVKHVPETNAESYMKDHPGKAPVVGDGEGNVVHDRFGNPVRSTNFETPPPGTNHFGIAVPTVETHIYADPGGSVYAYGGSPEERAKSILEYLTKNPNGVIYAADNDGKYRIPWYLVEGEAVPGSPMRTSGFLGFFKTWMEPPGPENFQKIIK